MQSQQTKVSGRDVQTNGKLLHKKHQQLALHYMTLESNNM